jgi:hypothetical protein
MAENFITYKEKPIVRSKNEIYYGDMAEAFVIKFTILSENANGDPDKIKVELLKSDTSLSDKDRLVKDTTKSSMFEALDVGFIWLERALKA